MTITRDVRTVYHAADREWEVVDPVVFTLPSGDTITVPAGFRTDGASVPRCLWWLFPRIDSYFAAAVIHDWLYRQGGVVDFPGHRLGRRAADRVFLLGCEACGTGYVWRRLMYYAVRFGGERSFRGIED